MMPYSLINFRRLDWFTFNAGVMYQWRDAAYIDPHQAALSRGAYR